MRLRIEPGATLSGSTRVPGDKSIAHRWLMLAATGEGTSVLRGLPTGLDVLSTARCLGMLLPESLLRTWSGGDLLVEGHGFEGLAAPGVDLDCGNSGTTMRLLCGLLAGHAGPVTLTGDESLSARPMERVAEPLRSMGAEVTTNDGHAPITVSGGRLRAITYATPVPSAQVKSAVLLAGLQAEGETTIEEASPSRDHTERALAALGAPTEAGPGRVSVSAFQHGGFEADMPGDASSAAFILAGAAVTGGDVAVRDVGLNPTRTHFVQVMHRMGVAIRTRELWESLREPGGLLEVGAGTKLRGTVVGAAELPLVIDEVPVLAALATHAEGETRFEGAGELRVKESDRLAGLESGLRALGASVEIQGEALVVGGGGMAGGRVDAGSDHRVGMALAVAALGASGDSYIGDMEWADVSFPGFAETLADLGARAEPA
jgi:3-phosphoshikimate 1-carboxyvinyltransferase